MVGFWLFLVIAIAFGVISFVSYRGSRKAGGPQEIERWIVAVIACVVAVVAIVIAGVCWWYYR